MTDPRETHASTDEVYKAVVDAYWRNTFGTTILSAERVVNTPGFRAALGAARAPLHAEIQRLRAVVDRTNDTNGRLIASRDDARTACRIARVGSDNPYGDIEPAAVESRRQLSGQRPVAGKQPLDLDAIRTRADAATPGPWSADTTVRGDCVVWGPNGRFLLNAQSEPHWVPKPDDGSRAVAFDVDRRDCEFIAHAREDIPELLADVDLLKAAADECMRQRDDAVTAELRAADLAQRAIALLIRTHDDEPCRPAPYGGGCIQHGYGWPCANAEAAKLIEEVDRG